MKREGKLQKKDLSKLIDVAREIFKKEGNLIQV